MDVRGAWFQVALAALVVTWGGNHFAPLLLLYRQNLGYSEVDVNIFFAMYALGVIPGILLAGPLSDRYGRRPLMIIGVFASAIGSAVLGLGSGSYLALSFGRLVVGLSVAIAMTVGTIWIKELSTGVAPAAAARRASIALTIGGAGTIVSGVIAQWAPWPTLTPYLAHIVLAVATGSFMLLAPETRSSVRTFAPLFANLILARRHRARFAGVVVPAALWVFAANALAVAVAPSLVVGQLGNNRVLFATLLTALTIATGTISQRLTGWASRVTRGHPLVLGIALIVAGTVMLATASLTQTVWMTLVSSVVLGSGYGITIVCGLIEVQAMADEDNSGGIASLYYAITFVGFLVPVILSALSHLGPSWLLLLVLAALCAVCATVVFVRTKRSS
jgi:MFS family permease